MTLIKKIDVEMHFARRQASRRAAALFASQPDATGFSGIEPAESIPAIRHSAEDFTREHSSSSATGDSVHRVAELQGNQARAASARRPL